MSAEVGRGALAWVQDSSHLRCEWRVLSTCEGSKWWLGRPRRARRLHRGGHERALRWEGKRGSGKCAPERLSPVPQMVGVENVRRQVVAWATLTLTRAVATTRRT
jgi:hypothetical protein